ncbi:MAG: hypothetical protein JWM09_135, partial [Francisellaceae bacterium]|nr:hypothetical protein [Francisellaceae bacterium]
MDVAACTKIIGLNTLSNIINTFACDIKNLIIPRRKLCKSITRLSLASLGLIAGCILPYGILPSYGAWLESMVSGVLNPIVGVEAGYHLEVLYKILTIFASATLSTRFSQLSCQFIIKKYTNQQQSCISSEIQDRLICTNSDHIFSKDRIEKILELNKDDSQFVNNTTNLNKNKIRKILSFFINQ